MIQACRLKLIYHHPLLPLYVTLFSQAYLCGKDCNTELRV